MYSITSYSGVWYPRVLQWFNVWFFFYLYHGPPLYSINWAGLKVQQGMHQFWAIVYFVTSYSDVRYHPHHRPNRIKVYSHLLVATGWHFNLPSKLRFSVSRLLDYIWSPHSPPIGFGGIQSARLQDGRRKGCRNRIISTTTPPQPCHTPTRILFLLCTRCLATACCIGLLGTSFVVLVRLHDVLPRPTGYGIMATRT